MPHLTIEITGKPKPFNVVSVIIDMMMCPMRWLRGLAVAVLLVVSAAWAGDFPQRFQVVCPQLLKIPDDYPDKKRLDQVCLQLSQKEFSLVREGQYWHLTPALDDTFQAELLLEPLHSWHPYTCLPASSVALCKIPAHTPIKVPGMGDNGWVRSRNGFILMVNMIGVFDLAPATDGCFSSADVVKPCKSILR